MQFTPPGYEPRDLMLAEFQNEIRWILDTGVEYLVGPVVAPHIVDIVFEVWQRTVPLPDRVWA